MDDVKLADGDSLVYSPSGHVAHILSQNYALCEYVPMWPNQWMGTGSQEEYEKAARLRLCRKCRKYREAK